jgi:lipoprotein-anchoring transpeptidase ErfK/SrfK
MISRRTLLPFTMSPVKYPIIIEYVDLTEINKKYKAKASGLSVGNSLKKIFSNVKVEQGRAKHDWTFPGLFVRNSRYFLLFQAKF